MFGYVRARIDALSAQDRSLYHAAYCGLCRALAERYGFAARFLVSYDMTFLYLVLASEDGPGRVEACRCPARVFGKKPCLCDAGRYRAVAARTVILSKLKLDDDVRDQSFFRSVPRRLLRLLYRRAYRKALRDEPVFAALAAAQLDRLHALEDETCGSIDKTADAFARIVSGCADALREESARRPAELMLYQVGRFIYLADALDDLSRDCKKDSYNPLRYRFAVQSGKLSPEDLQYLSELTDSSVNLAGASLALMPLKSCASLLENIVYYGLPAVFAAVRNGSFHSRAKEHPRKEQDT